jgi:hypothetical protein
VAEDSVCSHWFLDREFFYLEDGGDPFFGNVDATFQETVFFNNYSYYTKDNGVFFSLAGHQVKLQFKRFKRWLAKH